MRRFRDDAGTEWTVALSAGSYGSMTLMFAATGSTELYWLALEAASSAEGQDLLDGLSEDELRARLGRAEHWTG